MQNIIWFRTDLRTQDNPALYAALTSKPKQQVLAVFFISIEQWQQHGWGPNKIGFVLKSVLALQEELAELNVKLDIISCPDFKSQVQELMLYISKNNCNALYYNAEYELNERLRDEAIDKVLADKNIVNHKFHSQTLIEPGAILTQQKLSLIHI